MSTTMIDRVITNDVEHVAMPYVIQSSIIDHFTVMSKISQIQTSGNKTLPRSIEIQRIFARKLFLMN